MRKSAFGKLVCTMALCLAAMAARAQTFNSIVNFEGNDGRTPFVEALVQGTDGNFYGTTVNGGKYGEATLGYGAIFKVTPTGTMTLLHSFCVNWEEQCTDGYWPYVGLVQAPNGNFYGTTNRGGAHQEGKIGRAHV